MQVLVDSTNPTSGISSRLEFSLFYLLICGCRLRIFGLIYPWPLAIWVVTVLISVQYRFALQRKVLGIIRINKLLIISFTISILPGAVYALASLCDDRDDDTSVFPLWDLINFIFCCIVILMFLGWEIGCFLYGELFLLL